MHVYKIKSLGGMVQNTRAHSFEVNGIVHSCIGIRYAKLFEATKMHVQIFRFTCCLNMVLNLTNPKLGFDLFVCRYMVAALTDHFANAFVRKNVKYVYNVVGT